jgi:hypothetical protein
MSTFNDLPIEIQELIITKKEQLEQQDHKKQFQSCKSQISHCIHCNWGGTGWTKDDSPFWFCGPECIDEFDEIDSNHPALVINVKVSP